MGWASLRPCLTNSKFSRNAYLQDSLRSCGCKLVDKLLVQGNSAERVTDTDHLWLCAFGGIGAPVTTFYEIMEFSCVQRMRRSGLKSRRSFNKETMPASTRT